MRSGPGLKGKEVNQQMSRGYEGQEIDDFRDSSFGWGRDTDRDASSDWNGRFALRNIHREEQRADRRDTEGRERGDKDRPPVPREERVQQILSHRVRTKYTDRNRQYALRDSEIYTLGEVGKFRVVGVNDLAEFAYNGDRSRTENDVESLARQGILQRTTIADPEHNPTRMITLTKEGHKLLSRGKVVDSSQATYHGLKKPKEAFHDADLYRLYHKVSDEIESRGGSIVRVKLDYELKRELYARLARAAADKCRDGDTLRKEVAKRYHLKVVSGRIPIPDLRIEYVNENDNEIQRRDLELATEHYRPRGISEKTRAGFDLYARRGETDRLRRIRDERELSAAIFSL